MDAKITRLNSKMQNMLQQIQRCENGEKTAARHVINIIIQKKEEAEIPERNNGRDDGEQNRWLRCAASWGNEEARDEE